MAVQFWVREGLWGLYCYERTSEPVQGLSSLGNSRMTCGWNTRLELSACLLPRSSVSCRHASISQGWRAQPKREGCAYENPSAEYKGGGMSDAPAASLGQSLGRGPQQKRWLHVSTHPQGSHVAGG